VTRRTQAIVAALAVAAGAAAFATGLGDDDRARTYGTLIASWIFVAGVAAGALAFRAMFTIISARWAQPMARLGGAALGFAPIAMLVLLVIVTGAASWLHAADGSRWMSTPALTSRELAATAGVFLCGLSASRRGAVVYTIVFPIALSLWAFDLVLGADAVWESTMIGPLVFVLAFLGGTALVTLLAIGRGELDDAARGDAAKLVFALSIFWAYLFWSQYLTIWYGNLPDEVGFALRRTEDGWGVVVLVVIGLVFALPFVTLLHPAGRRSRRLLRALLALQLLGGWLECQLLIVPSLSTPGEPAFAVRDLLIALGLVGAFALSIARRVGPTPTEVERKAP
jgi:Ni/Fe-hydrogenase subunit HybB-like protein